VAQTKESIPILPFAQKGFREHLCTNATEDLNPLVPSSLQHFPAGYSASNFVLNRTYQTRFDPLQGARNIRTNGGSSKYHAGQLSINRRYANNFILQLSYTRSKFLDNGSDIFSTTGNNQTQSSAVPSIFSGLTRDWGLSNYDRPNRVAVTGVYELPFMRSQQGVVGHVVGGWQPRRAKHIQCNRLPEPGHRFGN